MEIISAVFAGAAIREGFGKLYVIKPVFSIDCG
jgi:ribosomal protein L24E